MYGPFGAARPQLLAAARRASSGPDDRWLSGHHGENTSFPYGSAANRFFEGVARLKPNDLLDGADAEL